MLVNDRIKSAIQGYEFTINSTSKKIANEVRISNDRKTKITGKILFKKKPTHWNNLFKSGFNGINKSFGYNPSQVSKMSTKRVSSNRDIKGSAEYSWKLIKA